jgi:hypothetical protein
MIDVRRFMNGVAATKEEAHHATEFRQREAWHGLAHHCLSLAVLFLPPQSVHLNYQLARDNTVHVLITLRCPGQTRAFHIPFVRLSAEAQLAVTKALGSPQTFLKDATAA